MSDPRGRDVPGETPSSHEALERAEDNVETQLAKRGVRLFGSESDDELLDLLNAAERFDAARAAAGGDSMTNTPESSPPDDPAFVIPERRDDESATAHARRVRAAADAIRRR